MQTIVELFPMWVINAAFAVWLWLCGYGFYYGMRRGFGYSLWRGRWVSAEELRRIKHEVSENFR